MNKENNSLIQEVQNLRQKNSLRKNVKRLLVCVSSQLDSIRKY